MMNSRIDILAEIDNSPATASGEDFPTRTGGAPPRSSSTENTKGSDLQDQCCSESEQSSEASFNAASLES